MRTCTLSQDVPFGGFRSIYARSQATFFQKWPTRGTRDRKIVPATRTRLQEREKASVRELASSAASGEAGFVHRPPAGARPCRDAWHCSPLTNSPRALLHDVPSVGRLSNMPLSLPESRAIHTVDWPCDAWHCSPAPTAPEREQGRARESGFSLPRRIREKFREAPPRDIKVAYIQGFGFCISRWMVCGREAGAPPENESYITKYTSVQR